MKVRMSKITSDRDTLYEKQDGISKAICDYNKYLFFCLNKCLDGLKVFTYELSSMISFPGKRKHIKILNQCFLA